MSPSAVSKQKCKKACSEAPPNGNYGNGHEESYFKTLREEKKLSQRELAVKIGISRTHLQRLESKPVKRLSLGEVELFSQGLGLKIQELVQRFGFVDRPDFMTRACLKNPFFVIDFTPGVQFASHVSRPEDCITGTLTMAPQKSLAKEQAPRSEFLYYLVLEGTLLLTVFSKEYLFKTGEFFWIGSNCFYELYNPHQFQNMLAVVCSRPSFFRTA